MSKLKKRIQTLEKRTGKRLVIIKIVEGDFDDKRWPTEEEVEKVKAEGKGSNGILVWDGEKFW